MWRATSVRPYSAPDSGKPTPFRIVLRQRPTVRSPTSLDCLLVVYRFIPVHTRHVILPGLATRSPTHCMLVVYPKVYLYTLPGLVTPRALTACS
jgi:hypothetical protein